MLLLAHRKELIEQLGETAKNLFKMQVSHISPDLPYKPHCKLQIGSVQTVINRLDKIKKPKLIIIDEAHHYSKSNTYDKILKYYNTFSIGFTATPKRLSGEPLNDFFDHLISGPSVKWLIDNNYLCDYDIFQPPNNLDFSQTKISMGDFKQSEVESKVTDTKITGSAIDEYRKYCTDKRAVAFCVSVKHAYLVAEQFRSSGIAAVCIEGSTGTQVRSQIIKEFKEGKIKVLTNCSIVTEGFDLPAIESVIQLRPTASLALYLQMVGRGLRTMPGKDKAILLDHVGNVKRHGLPCQDREWTLDGRVKPSKSDGGGGVSVKTCPNCFMVLETFMKKCENCGHEFIGEGRKIEEEEGELVKLDKEKYRGMSFAAARDQAETMDDLIALGKAKGMKNAAGWAKHVYLAREFKKRVKEGI